MWSVHGSGRTGLEGGRITVDEHIELTSPDKTQGKWTLELYSNERFRITGEIGQLRNITMQVCESDGQRIEFGMSLGKQDPDIFSIVPGQVLRHLDSV